jgi:hypothetical protein
MLPWGCELGKKGPPLSESTQTHRKMGALLMFMGAAILVICGLLWLFTLLSGRLPQASGVIGMYGHVLIIGMGFIFLGVCTRYTTE